METYIHVYNFLDQDNILDQKIESVKRPELYGSLLVVRFAFSIS